jgi:amidase
MFSPPAESCLTASLAPRRPKRIAFSSDLKTTEVDDAVRHQFESFIQRLEQEQLELVEDAPALQGVHDSFDALRAHEYAIGLEQSLIDHPGTMKPEVEWNIEQGLKLSSEDLRTAARQQGQIINQAADFMQNYDLLLCPATSVLSVDAELRYPGSDQGVPYSDYYRWLGIAYATTMTTLPVITLPVAVAADGMRFAVQLIGKPFGEASLFSHARFIEELIDLPTEPVELS